MEPISEELIRGQIKKAEEKLAASKSLRDDGFLDDAISRAYYVMFHGASAALLAEGITVESHSALKDMFGLHLVLSGKVDKKYGRWLNMLKDERENGDYDIFTSFDKEDADSAIKKAEEFFTAMKQFLSERHGLLFLSGPEPSND